MYGYISACFVIYSTSGRWLLRFISVFGLKKKNILFFSRKLTLPLFLPSRVTLYYAAICIVSSSCPRVDLHILAAVYERISNRVLFFSLKVEAFSCWALLIYQLETVTRPINGMVKLLFTHNYFFLVPLKYIQSIQSDVNLKKNCVWINLPTRFCFFGGDFNCLWFPGQLNSEFFKIEKRLFKDVRSFARAFR